jgi:hypothetical protein
MLEANFGTLFEREILPAVPAFAEVAERGGLVVDLGCGNDWYLRRLAARASRSTSARVGGARPPRRRDGASPAQRRGAALSREIFRLSTVENPAAAR